MAGSIDLIRRRLEQWRVPAATAGAAVGGTMILSGSLAERFAVLRAEPPLARATATGETVRATASELGRPPRPAWQR